MTIRQTCRYRSDHQSNRAFQCNTKLSFRFVASRKVFCSHPILIASVWGPEKYKLGFVGIPLSAAVSHNVLAALAAFYIFPRISYSVFCENAHLLFNDLSLFVRVVCNSLVRTVSTFWSTELLGGNRSFSRNTILNTKQHLLVCEWNTL